MYHIAICDDEPYMLELLEAMAAEITKDMGILPRISCCSSLRELEGLLNQEDAPVHLLLLDILMGAVENGMDFALKLRQQGWKTGIIFITSSIDFVLKGYDVQAIKYIVKPVEREELAKAIAYNYHNYYKQEFLAVHLERHIANIRIRDILYLEIAGKMTAIYLVSGERMVCRERIAELQQELPPNTFCRCHQSFIINLEQVTEIVRYQARLSVKREIPVSKRYFDETREAFMRLLMSRLRQ